MISVGKNEILAYWKFYAYHMILDPWKGSANTLSTLSSNFNNANINSNRQP